ncbi:MAG: AraC family transcriptional regulator [Victivallaceae bacterium]|nr:AraC family transcriptional regulator [Victivallaceae bacterium]
MHLTCRLWEVHFEITGRLDSLPYPGEIVREVQKKPSYYIDCGKRGGLAGAQFVYTLTGEGRFKIGDKVISLFPGTAFLQNHGNPRNAYYYPKGGIRPWHFIWISFFSPTVERMIEEITAAYGQIYYIPRDAELIKMLFSYEQPRNTPRFISPLEGTRLVMEVLMELGNYLPAAENHRRVSPGLIRRVQEYIHNHLGTTLTVEAVAREYGVSREHLSRIFREQLGQTPSEYLIKCRVERACRLLISTDLSCKEIAAMVGYDNSVSFSRAFKRVVQMTPGELRRAGYSPQIR